MITNNTKKLKCQNKTLLRTYWIIQTILLHLKVPRLCLFVIYHVSLSDPVYFC